MYENAYQDKSRYYSSILVVFFGKLFFKIVNSLMPIIGRRDLHTSSENLIDGEVIYRPNNNNLARTLILPQNSTKLLEEFVGANYLIYLVKLLIICPTLIFFQYFKYIWAVLALSFICGNIRL